VKFGFLDSLPMPASERRYDKPRGYPVYKINSSLRSALLLGAATAAAVSLTGSALAQQANVETVIVTGSRIPQVGIVSPSPVTMVGQGEMKLEGTTDVGTLLNNLPSVFAGQTSGEGNGASGTVTVDLRGLGPSRTLVLIDGKRLGPGDAEVPVPDLNQIPSALIDHTEVLTGGASAVYGSDAVAGVINFIMRKDFEGIEIDANMGAYQHDNGNSYLRGLQSDAGFAHAPDSVFDGSSYDTTLILGTNTANGKGNVTAYLGYSRQNQVLQSARDGSACSLSNFTTGTTPGGVAVRGGLYCAGSFNYDAFYSITGPGAYHTFFMEPGGHLTAFSGAANEYFNYGAYNTLMRPQTRYEGGAFAHYEIDKMLDVYANFMFTDTHNSWQAAPSAAFFQQGLGPYGSEVVSCDNPLLTGTDFLAQFCPGGVASTANATVLMARRNVEGGPRITDFRHTSYRMVAGAKGELGDGWTYDASAQEGLALYQQLYLADWSKQAVTDSLLYDDTTGNCVSGTCLDLFHGIGAITPDMEKVVTAHGQRTGYTEEQVLTASITGDLGQYGIQSPLAKAGVGIAGGAEYRKEVLEETTSMADQSGDLFGAGGKALGQDKSSFHVWEVFAETKVPIVSDKEFVQDLSANAGYRYSSYSTTGAKAVTSYKYGLEWQPIDDFRFRGSFQRAVRAANILDLFSPQNVVLGSYSDPCANTGGQPPTASLAQCEATGVTAAQYGHILQCASNQCNYLSGGNEALKPEKSNTRSLGIVLQPTFLTGFTATIDYFNIDVKDYIGSVPQTVVMAGCISGSNPIMCTYFHRGASGSLATTDGYIVGTNVNTGYLHTKGIDFEANYITDLADFGLGDNGSLALNMFGTYVSDYLVQPYSGADVGGIKDYNCVGLYGVSCGTPTPSWRHKARITWATPWDISFSFDWRHMSGSKFDGNSTNPFIQQDYIIPKSGGGAIASFDYLDFALTWDATNSIRLSAGVNNIFDRNPPILASGGKTTGPTGPLNGNTFDGIYDSLGRYFFMGITLKS